MPKRKEIKEEVDVDEENSEVELEEVEVEESFEEVETEETFGERVKNLLDAMVSMEEVIKALKKETRSMRTAHNREIAQASNKKKRKRVQAVPRGINSPNWNPSNELCDFLDIPHDSLHRICDLTSMVNKYIRVNSLQNKKNKKEIVPDKKMAKWLSEPKYPIETDPNELGFTFTNLNKYIRDSVTKKE